MLKEDSVVGVGKCGVSHKWGCGNRLGTGIPRQRKCVWEDYKKEWYYARISILKQIRKGLEWLAGARVAGGVTREKLS